MSLPVDNMVAALLPHSRCESDYVTHLAFRHELLTPHTLL